MIVIKQVDKGSCVAVSCRDDYIKELINNIIETIEFLAIESLHTQIFNREGTQILFLWF